MLVAVLVAFMVMNLVYLLVRWTGRVAIVDVGWAYGVVLVLFLYASAGTGEPWRRVLLLVMGGGWGLRLGTHLLTDRVLRGAEDGRYVALMKHWGKGAGRKMFWFHQAQAVLVVVMSLPFYSIANGLESALRVWDIAALALWLVSIAGEALADRQLARWRSDPANAGRTCNSGLWRYSRHPNYFFEWLHWWAYVLLGLSAPHGWLTLIGPVLMFAFLFRFTGIPYAETQALRSRGEDYARYQRTTNRFFPWRPKKELQQ